MSKTETSRILFVDDEPRVLSALKRNLRQRQTSWDINFCSDSQEALRLHLDKPFDVIVSDLAMPNLDGFSMIMKMRQAASRTRFIMLTGTADLNAAVDAINRAEVFRFFTKPCAAELLIEGIEAALSDGRRQAVVGGEGRATAISDAIGVAALNRLAVGVIVTNAQGRVLLTNRAGGAILAERDGLMLGAGEMLRGSLPSESQTLLSVIARVCSLDDQEDGQTGIAISRPSMKRSLIALVTAIQIESDHAAAAIFVNDDEHGALPNVEAISRLFGLNRSEARLAHALAEGAKIEDASQKLGITVSTARTYLKQAFSKTGTNRQAELVKLIMTTPTVS